MKGHLTESRIETDGTDELPVLSDEAILRFRVATAVETEPPDGTKAAPARPAGEAEQRQGTPDEDDAPPLEASLETLRATLETAEQRWQRLEKQLKSQDQAIAELKSALYRPQEPPPALRPVLASAPAKPETAPSEAAAALDTGDASSPADERYGGEKELLERIAALETYIAGRADHWREMELEVSAKSTRIAELEAELAQRIAREQQLEESLHLQGGRAEALRDKLRRMNRRLEHEAATDSGPDPDPTSELTGPVGKAPSIVLNTSNEPGPESGSAPELVCLSSDFGERYLMNKEAITIGRSAECDIQISADFVSRQHATIRRNDREMYIEDESSTNGVYVNAVRVRRKTLADGDEITIGESRFRFVVSPPSH